MNGLAKETRTRVQRLAELLSQEEEPPAILNRHCVECEFREQCRKIVIEKDDLSLLANMSLKERKKNHEKGIFTVAQLSYTFKPRRNKNPGSRVAKFSYPLKALAIRQKKVHIAGNPSFEIEGHEAFLDVEGVPDREFYFGYPD